jgi:uncharacterized protein DUF4136
MTRLNTIGVTALGLVAGFAITVAAQDVSTDYDKATDFSKYRSFSAQIATSWGNPFGEKRALEIIENALVAKGWKKVDAAAADATVMIHGASQVKRDLNTFYSGYGGYRYGGMGTSTTTVNEYTVGTMVVDIFDSKSKQLIWRGVGTDEASDKADKNQKKIAKATEKMFKKFPPRPGQ